jgi:hypothetical protein
MRVFFLLCSARLCKDEDPEAEDRPSKWLLPHQVVAVELLDEVIKERAMNVPESDVNQTRNSEEGLFIAHCIRSHPSHSASLGGTSQVQ